jgi:hypothetical protein
MESGSKEKSSTFGPYCIPLSLPLGDLTFTATCHPEDFENAGVIFGAGMT